MPCNSIPIEISVIIPCLNERDTLRSVVCEVTEKLKGYPAEIVVVDNGSTDGGLETIGDLPIRIEYEPRRGKAEAVKKGLLVSQGSVVILMDADGEYGTEVIPSLIEEYRKGADMVYGVRYTYPYSIITSSFIANKLILALIKSFYRTEILDVFSGVRAFTKDKFVIQSSGFVIETEIVLQAAVKGLKVAPVPVLYRPRTKKEGKKIGLRDFMQIMAYFTRERLRHVVF